MLLNARTCRKRSRKLARGTGQYEKHSPYDFMSMRSLPNDFRFNVWTRRYWCWYVTLIFNIGKRTEMWNSKFPNENWINRLGANLLCLLSNRLIWNILRFEYTETLWNVGVWNFHPNSIYECRRGWGRFGSLAVTRCNVVIASPVSHNFSPSYRGNPHTVLPVLSSLESATLRKLLCPFGV